MKTKIFYFKKSNGFFYNVNVLFSNIGINSITIDDVECNMLDVVPKMSNVITFNKGSENYNTMKKMLKFISKNM